MCKYLRTALVLVLGVTLLAATARADQRQANELRERANALQEKVQRLNEEGKHDVAQQLKRQVDELYAKADRVAGQGPQEPGLKEALGEKLRGLYKEWIEAYIHERYDVAEDIQRKIHEIARDTGARMEELLKPQLEMMERRIDELRQQGKMELADRLAQQLHELIQAHRKSQQQPPREGRKGPRGGEDWGARIHELERRREELRQQGNNEQAEQVERELEKVREMAQRAEHERHPEGRPGPGPQDREEMQRRIHHLRAAADNLHAIGMQDLAQRLCNEADNIQRSLENPPPPPGDGGPHDVMEQLRNEIRGLHERVNELNRRLDEMSEMLNRERR